MKTFGLNIETLRNEKFKTFGLNIETLRNEKFLKKAT